MTDNDADRQELSRLDTIRAMLAAAGNVALDWKSGDRQVVMVPTARPAGTAPGAATGPRRDSADRTVTADGAGLFRPANRPGGAPLAGPGTSVAAGQVLAMLQVGAAMLPVTAPAAGRIEAVMADDGALVGYGTPLFRLRAHSNTR